MIISKAAKLMMAGAFAITALGIGVTHAADKSDLSPDTSNRVRAEKDEAAIKAISPDFKFVTPGTFTVAVNAWDPPIATYATDAKTVVGADPDLASLLADSLGLKLEVVSVAWADWPLGV